MALYADQPGRRLRQVLGDLGVLVWVVAWVVVGLAVHTTVAGLAAPGRTLEGAGSSLEEGLTAAGDRVAELPVVGDELREPFDAAGGAAASITEAGVGFQQGVERAALVAALAVAVWPVVVVLGLWLWARARFTRRSAAARRLLRGGADLDLFALRALARLPLPVLAGVSQDPAGDWRRGHPDVVRALAALELHDSGVALPEPRSGTGG